VANNSAGKNVKKTGRIYYTQVATTPEGEPVMMGTFLVANHPAVILFDSGASHTFISKNIVEKYCIHCTESREGFIIHSPEGQIFTKEIAFHVPVTLAERVSHQHDCLKRPRYRCDTRHELVGPALSYPQYGLKDYQVEP
jgi:hypothetical protein